MTRIDLRRTPLAAAAIALALFLTLLPYSARAQDAAGSAALSDQGQQLLAALNARRAEAGLAQLQPDAQLNQAAQTHANDVYHNGNYSHWGTDGTLVEGRVARTGYSSSPWVSENWVSSGSAASAMNWWMNDYVHRVNILTPRWREVGVGVAGAPGSGEMIFVTVFSVGRDAAGVDGPVVAASSASARASAPSSAAVPGQHVVQPGDTLLAIGLRYGLDYVDIAGANGLASEAVLQIGQVLRMPGPGDALGSGIGGPTGGPTIETVAYEIKSGETLYSIAARNDISWQDLAGINGLSEGSILQVGQEIRVPAPSVAAEPAADSAPDPALGFAPARAETSLAVDPAYGAPASAVVVDEPVQYHVVVPGDTVIGIAERYDMAWGELLELNGLDDDSVLQPGALLRLQ